jgi:hypothetical protein
VSQICSLLRLDDVKISRASYFIENQGYSTALSIKTSGQEYVLCIDKRCGWDLIYSTSRATQKHPRKLKDSNGIDNSGNHVTLHRRLAAG